MTEEKKGKKGKTQKQQDIPKISVLTCTYNGEKTIENCLKGLFMQDYPLEKIEWIFADGGSSDKTVEIIKKWQKKYPKVIKFYENKAQFSDGRGKGYDIFSRKAQNELIWFMDQDNILVQKDWIKNMVKILVENSDIQAVQSRMIIPKNGTILDKYLNAIGIEDPFAIHYSLNAQIVLNPEKFKFNEKGNFWEYQIDTQDFYYAGSNGFMIRREAFFNSGGWNQDTDLFYRMGLNHYKVAVPKDVKIYHQTSTNLKHFLTKRGFYVQYYLSQNYEGRDFYWFDLKKNTSKQNFRFIRAVLFNMTIIPGLIQGLRMYFKTNKKYWLLHPFILFSITSSYILVKIFTILGIKIKKF